MTDYLYRYDSHPYVGSGPHLALTKYKIIKTTPCGVRISLYDWSLEYTKFVNLNAKKQWACKTPEEAFTSFKARKNRQIQILTAQLENARVALRLTPEKPTTTVELHGEFARYE